MREAGRPLAGKIAVVTGASRGIGRAVALQLAKDGASAVLGARDADTLGSAVDAIESAGGDALACPLDLRDPAAPGKLIDAAIARFGAIDIVVNSAGATQRGDFVAMPDSLWEDGFALKFYSTVRVTRAAWPHLKARRGSVVNVVGVRGRMPPADYAIGGSVNAAVMALTKALAELGITDGVQVNAVNPGAVMTDRQMKVLTKASTEQGISIEQVIEQKIRDQRIIRIGEAGDIAHMVSFIVSPRGRLLQGALIDMDGGENKSL